MISRRQFVGMSLGAAGAALTLRSEWLRAYQQQSGRLIQRAIPSSGEMLPVVGLQFGNPPPPDHDALKEVLKTLLDNGGTVLDTVHQSPAAEEVSAEIATELGVQDRIFWSSRASPPGPPQPGGADQARAQMETSIARFKVDKLDLAMMNPMADAGHLAAMKAMKKEGRVRYIGMQVIDDRQYGGLEAVMRNEPIDFIGVDYSIDNRGAEQTILPLAQERKIAVMAFLPFDMGSLFKRAGAAPLPAWAAEIDATTWAQFFLKYVISHPAVTVVRTGTGKPAHMLENIAAGAGRFPDAAMRRRMTELVDSWPQPGGSGQTSPQSRAAVTTAMLDRYAGEYKTTLNSILTFRRVGAALHVTADNSVESPLVARSETRFSDPWGATFEFQLDPSGAVTGVVHQQGSHLKVPASRIR